MARKKQPTPEPVRISYHAEGERAHDQGHTITFCPYAPSDWRYEIWRAGWKCAAKPRAKVEVVE